MVQQTIAEILLSIVVGLIITFLGLIFEYKSGWFVQTETTVVGPVKTRAAYGIILFSIVGITTFLIIQFFSPNITIESLRDRDTVPHNLDLAGVYRNISRETDIWIYVWGGSDRKFYFFETIKYENGIWEAKRITIGSDRDVDVAYTIGVISADRLASAEIRRNPSGRNELPNGTQHFDEVIVIRNSPITTQTLEPVFSLQELEQQLFIANILLTGGPPFPPAPQERIERVRSYLQSDPGYQALARNCLAILNGNRFRKEVHLDTINGKYVNKVNPGAAVLLPQQYNDLQKLQEAILEHWNELYPIDPANSIEQVIEAVPGTLLTSASSTSGTYRPTFLFNPPGTFQSKNGLEPLISQLHTNQDHVSYSFEYDLPQGEENQYAGFVIFSDEPANMAAYKYIRVVVTFNDPEAKCEVLLRDFNDNLRYIRLDESSANLGTRVVANGNTYTVLIPLQSFAPVDPRNIMQIGFQAHTNFITGKHSIVIEDISFANE